jgi:tryptophanyl-tRNA synthetase
MKIFSGIKPTGVPHLGNYLGAFRQYLEYQDQGEAIYFIADLHALTTLPNPPELGAWTYDVTALLIAIGIDPAKSTLFAQSMQPAHAQLAWVMQCLVTMGELGRMTQYKEKRGTDEERTTGAGLFVYPTLMAADILLYQTDVVPVGEDQTQHVELARDLAKRFNQRYPTPPGGSAGVGGDTFVVPKLQLKEHVARIMALDDPTKKMSKSAASTAGYILLTDDADMIQKKIQRAVTDSGSDISYTSDRPAIKNLLTIYAGITGEVPDGIVNRYVGRGYAEFKSDLAEVIIEHLKPIQTKYRELRPDESTLRMLLKSGAERIAPLAHQTLKTVYDRVGLV